MQKVLSKSKKLDSKLEQKNALSPCVLFPQIFFDGKKVAYAARCQYKLGDSHCNIHSTNIYKIRRKYVRDTM